MVKDFAAFLFAVMLILALFLLFDGLAAKVGGEGLAYPYPAPSGTPRATIPTSQVAYPWPTNTPRPTWDPPSWWPPYPLPSLTPSPTGAPAEMMSGIVISLPEARATQTAKAVPSCEEQLRWALGEIANLRATITAMDTE